MKVITGFDECKAYYSLHILFKNKTTKQPLHRSSVLGKLKRGSVAAHSSPNGLMNGFAHKNLQLNTHLSPINFQDACAPFLRESAILFTNLTIMSSGQGV